MNGSFCPRVFYVFFSSKDDVYPINNYMSQLKNHWFFFEIVCLFFEIVWWFYSLEFVCDFMDWGFPLIFVRMFI